MSKSKRKQPQKPTGNTSETRAAEALTVAWMLTVVATLFAEIVAIGSWLVIQWVGIDAAPRGLIVLPVVMWTTATITGLLDLLLGVVTYRIRIVRAPTPILVVAVTVGIVPLLALLAILA